MTITIDFTMHLCVCVCVCVRAVNEIHRGDLWQLPMFFTISIHPEGSEEVVNPV